MDGSKGEKLRDKSHKRFGQKIDDKKNDRNGHNQGKKDDKAS